MRGLSLSIYANHEYDKYVSISIWLIEKKLLKWWNDNYIFVYIIVIKLIKGICISTLIGKSTCRNSNVNQLKKFLSH